MQLCQSVFMNCENKSESESESEKKVKALFTFENVLNTLYSLCLSMYIFY